MVVLLLLPAVGGHHSHTGTLPGWSSVSPHGSSVHTVFVVKEPWLVWGQVSQGSGEARLVGGMSPRLGIARVLSGFVTLSRSFEFPSPQSPHLRSYNDVSGKDFPPALCVRICSQLQQDPSVLRAAVMTVMSGSVTQQ